MKKTSLSSALKTRNIVVVLNFFVFLIIFSSVWGIIFAQNSTTSTTCTSLSLVLNDGKTAYTVGDSVNYTWTCLTAGPTSNVSMRLYKPDNTSTLYNSGSGSSTQTMGFSTSNLVPGTYVLKACFDSVCSIVGASQNFDVVAPVSVSIPPNAPTGLTAVVGGSDITLNWVDNSSNEAGFKIYRGPIWTDIGNVGANVTTFFDSNRPAGTYTYHINAFNSNNIYSPISNDVSATINNTTTIPPSNTTTTTSGSGTAVTTNTTGTTSVTTCTGLSLILTGNKTSYVVGDSVNYTWACTPTGTSGNASIWLQKPDNTSTMYTYGTSTGTTLGFSTSNLIPGTYILKACLGTSLCVNTNASQTFDLVSNTTVGTPVSNISSTTSPTVTTTGVVSNSPATTSGAGTTISIPLTPTNLKLNNISTASFISLYWTDNSNNENKFNIERKLSNTTAWAFLAQVGTNIIYYIDTTAIPGMTYDYRVQACLSGTGCSDYTTLEKVLILPSSTTTSPTLTTAPPLPTTTPATTTTTSTTTTPTNSIIPTATTTHTTTPTTTTTKLTTATTAPVSSTNPTSLTTPISTSINTFTGGSVANTGSPLPVFDVITTPITEGNTILLDKINSLQSKLNTTTDPGIQTTFKAQISALQSQVQTFQINQATSTTTQAPATAPTINVFSSKVQDLGTIVNELNTAVGDTKNQLVKTINQSVTDIVNNTTSTSGQIADINKINALQDKLIKKVDSSLSTSTAITSADINNLNIEINKGINDIQIAASGNTTTVEGNNTPAVNITNTLSALGETVDAQTEILKSQGGDLLYKDTNKDGISDYDSVYVYNMSPATPSPVSTYEGKSINASDKILLGFDPTQKEIVEVKKEQPEESTITPVSTYKVKEVALTEKKEVVFKGQALPNSFVTIYIYSTPIMVTVKTDSNGEWQYVLNKELENGDHTVYTATVNNSGNIIAKSTPFAFTKTAEAATLKDIPLISATSNASTPGLLDNNNLYGIVIILIMAMILILVVIGMTSKKNKENS